ncbi:hypothetical protein [Amycolatopsis sacchari]|uniref:hypothetical protein n=1 Tax=Amycolatopsis sacchari TaxID=115433 RepID=UPI003D741F89
MAGQARRLAGDRWYRRHESADEAVQLAAADAFYAARTEAWAAYYRMVVAGADAGLASLAERTIAVIGDVEAAADQAQLRERRERAAESITRFARSAAARLRADA